MWYNIKIGWWIYKRLLKIINQPKRQLNWWRRLILRCWLGFLGLARIRLKRGYCKMWLLVISFRTPRDRRAATIIAQKLTVLIIILLTWNRLSKWWKIANLSRRSLFMARYMVRQWRNCSVFMRLDSRRLPILMFRACPSMRLWRRIIFRFF